MRYFVCLLSKNKTFRERRRRAILAEMSDCCDVLTAEDIHAFTILPTEILHYVKLLISDEPLLLDAARNYWQQNLKAALPQTLLVLSSAPLYHDSDLTPFPEINTISKLENSEFFCNLVRTKITNLSTSNLSCQNNDFSYPATSRHELTVRDAVIQKSSEDQKSCNACPPPLSALRTSAAPASASLLLSKPSVCQKEQRQMSNMLMTMLTFNDQDRINIRRAEIKQAKSSGMDIIYLPLMPTYKIPGEIRENHSPSLADLLRNLQYTENVSSSELGNYLYMTCQGYYTFAFAGRADDFICLGKRELRKLTAMIREYVLTRDLPTMAIIETSGLSNDNLSIIASLANKVVIALSTMPGTAGEIIRRETSVFLNSLPATCHIEEWHG